MKRFGKAFALLIAVIFAASVFSLTAAASQEPEPVLTVSEVSGVPEDDVSVEVKLENNPGIAGYKLTLNYDPDILEYQGFDDSDVLLQITKGDNGEIKVENGTITVVGFKDNNVNGDGTLFTVNFKVKDDARDDSQLTLSFGKDDDIISAVGEKDEDSVYAYVNPDIQSGLFTFDWSKFLDILDLGTLDDTDKTALAESVKKLLDDIVQKLDDIDNLIKLITDGDTSVDDILALIAKLEALLEDSVIKAAVGIDDVEMPDIENDDDLKAIFGTGKSVKAVGAAFNSRGNRKINRLDITPKDSLTQAELGELPGDIDDYVALEIKLIGQENGAAESAITGSLDVPVTITIPVPVSLLNGGATAITIYHIDSNINLVGTSTTVTIVDGTITFTVTRFSTFVFVEANPDGTFNVSGRVRSYNPNNPTTITLTREGDGKEFSTTIIAVSGSGQTTQDFTIENVEEGIYTLVVNKAVHTRFTVESISVNDDIAMEQHANPAIQTITLLCGDVNGDNIIDSTDLNLVWNAANYGKSATAGGVNPLCDINGDGIIDSTDLNLVWNAVNYGRSGINLIYTD